MKKISETYKELGIDFTFPIRIKNAEGYETYYEDSDGYWEKSEYDASGEMTYYDDSDGYWEKSEYDAKGRETRYEDSNDFWSNREYDINDSQTYYEDSNGLKEGTPRTQSCNGKKYNFVIARLRDEDECPTDKERLCVYMSYSKEVHYGTEEDAFNIANAISLKKQRDYKPYFIDLKQNLVKI